MELRINRVRIKRARPVLEVVKRQRNSTQATLQRLYELRRESQNSNTTTQLGLRGDQISEKGMKTKLQLDYNTDEINSAQRKILMFS